MSNTENLNLFLTSESPPDMSFKEWRYRIDGEIDSNMTKIDTAYKELQDSSNNPLNKIEDMSIPVTKMEGVKKRVNMLQSNNFTYGGIGDTGNISTSTTTFKIWDGYISVTPNETIYRYRTDSTVLIGCYNMNKEWVQRIARNAGEESITIPDGVYFIRICEQSKIIDQTWTREKPLVNYPYGTTYDFSENPLYMSLSSANLKFPLLKNKRWLFIGDSITAGNGASGDDYKYPNKCGQYSGALITNAGVGGSTISYRGRNIDGSVKSAYTLSTEIDFTQYDIVTLFIGTNDWSYPQTLDDLSTNSSPQACVEYAFDETIKNILTSNPSIRIAVFTPMYRDRRGTAGDGFNSDEYGIAPKAEYDKNYGNPDKVYYLQDICTIMENICEKYHVPCKNMYKEFMVNKQNASILLIDGLHPNDEGYDRIANTVCAFVSEKCGF